MKKALTDEELEECRRAIVEDGALLKDLATRFGVAVYTMRGYSKAHRWPTARRIAAASKRNDLPLTDPAKAIAVDWQRRKDEAREKLFQGSKRALDAFYAAPPRPQDWKEAEIAQRLMDKAITPDDQQDTRGAINIAILQGSLNPFSNNQ